VAARHAWCSSTSSDLPAVIAYCGRIGGARSSRDLAESQAIFVGGYELCGRLFATELERTSCHGARETSLFELLSPHICRAPAISDILKTLHADVLEATLDGPTAGVYLTRRDGHVVYMNAAAECQVKTGNALRIVNNRLDPQTRGVFEMLIARATLSPWPRIVRQSPISLILAGSLRRIGVRFDILSQHVAADNFAKTVVALTRTVYRRRNFYLLFISPASCDLQSGCR
jgi:hypothetical protein